MTLADWYNAQYDISNQLELRDVETDVGTQSPIRHSVI